MFISTLPVVLPLAMSAPSGEGGPSPWVNLIPFAVILVIFYMLIIRPQARRQKEHQGMLKALDKGDRVLTNGGIYATILNVKEDIIVATIADGVKVELSRSAIAAKVGTKKKS